MKNIVLHTGRTEIRTFFNPSLSCLPHERDGFVPNATDSPRVENRTGRHTARVSLRRFLLFRHVHPAKTPLSLPPSLHPSPRLVRVQSVSYLARPLLSSS